MNDGGQKVIHVLGNGNEGKSLHKMFIIRKLKLSGFHPFKMKKSDFSHNLTDMPSVEAINITTDIVLQTASMASQMKACKSLEAYFVFG